MSPVDRRDFLRHAPALAAGFSPLGSAARAGDDDEQGPKSVRRVGSHDTIRLAVLGVRGRGMDHVSGFGNVDDVRITTICDVDEKVIGKAMAAVEKRYGAKPKYVPDL